MLRYVKTFDKRKFDMVKYFYNHTCKTLDKEKIMIEKISYFTLKCDAASCYETGRFKNFQEMRKNKWAVSRDRKHCYCPNCRKWYTVGIPYYKRENY